MDKIKITFFLPTLEIGGTERVALNLIQNLDKEKFRVSILLGKAKGSLIEKIPKEVELINFDLSRISLTFFKLVKYLLNEKPDIFISFLSHVNVISLLAKIFSRTKIKFVISERTTFSLSPEIVKNLKNKLITIFILKPLVKLLYPLADAIVCVSKGVAEDLANFLGSQKKMKVIYNPIVSQEIYKLAKESVDHPWFDEKIPIIIAVGRLTKAKDYPTLFKAFSLILKEKNARLIILGGGEERKNLENLVNKLKISKNVTFLGSQENPYKFMKKATLLALSSKVEGFPNVLVEAMACGLPVISTDCPSGPREIIENGKNGILVPVGNEKALAQAIIKVLNDPGLRHKFSEEGKKRAQDFIVEKSVREYEKLFYEISKNSLATFLSKNFGAGNTI